MSVPASLLEGIVAHRRGAVVDEDGARTPVSALLERAAGLSARLRAHPDFRSGARVAFRIVPSADWVVALWGIWGAGGAAVPVAQKHPRPEIEFVRDDLEVELALAEENDRDMRACFGERCLSLDGTRGEPSSLVLPAPEAPALVLYTSGTTGRPKGVVHSHRSLKAQVDSLVEAWAISEADRILHVLPLHHIHGIVNALLCLLAVGGEVHFAPFEPRRCLRELGGIDDRAPPSLFMAVPTLYTRLVDAFDALDEAEQARIGAGMGTLRLMVSGSAALPRQLFERWRALSGQTLLERYGMSEFGMALSNPLAGERRAGEVGLPLPGIEVRLVDEAGVVEGDGQGEIRVRAAQLFAGYHRRPEAKAEAFDEEGFFRTGDLAAREQGRYRILGRSSVDILKTGGEKVSALEVEHHLLDHESIAACAVVGLPHAEWGEELAAAVVLRPEKTLALDELRAFGKARLAVYKVPRRLLLVDDLPRNAMGKVQKKKVAALFTAG